MNTSPKWQRLVFGGAGWKVNGNRRTLIDKVKMNLEMWRDFDDPAYLARAKELMEDAQ